MSALRRIWPWVRPYRRFGALALLGSLTSVLINLSIPLQTSRVIDDGILADDPGLVRRVVITMILLILGGMVMSAFASAMAVRLAFNTVTDLRRDLYDHTQSLSFGNLDRLSSGEILTRLTSDITKVTTVLTMGLSFMAQTPVMFVGALLAIVAIDLSLVVIVLVMVPVIGLVVWYTLARSGQLYDAVQSRLDRLNTVLQENIQGAEVVKAFVRQDHETQRLDAVADDLADQATIVNQLVASLMPTLIVISSLGISAVIWLGGNNVIEGDLSEGDLVAFLSYMAMVAMPMMMFAFLQPILSAAGASM
jgi:ATP-binding cassette subfamily B protein